MLRQAAATQVQADDPIPSRPMRTQAREGASNGQHVSDLTKQDE
jgi:hypothetical protein